MSWPEDVSCKRGKSPGTQVQHALAIGTKNTKFRHFLASDCGTIWADTKSARTFAPLTVSSDNPLEFQENFRFYQGSVNVPRYYNPDNRQRLLKRSNLTKLRSAGLEPQEFQASGLSLRSPYTLDAVREIMGRCHGALINWLYFTWVCGHEAHELAMH